ncbi:hypothetical protein N7532_004565 [Penicillium argentinense]|uniref:Uncharacterized protein n=1 Tax=Penicillium argentinense TaxID=1131581 RepID=A0A9W9FPL1_9EURO|nr:uncharacterized protein N7532_004565 [Penicillium argentinense]KAJ5104036.1 hypothetical protein N7532_004565 [Penicillium argentinense]
MSDFCTEITPQCPVELTTYGYYPNLGGNTFFTIYFGLLGIAQVCLGAYFRTWTFLAALGIGTFMEAAGYVGRILMHYNPWSTPAFRLQIFCLILAPTFIAAGIYLTLKHIIVYIGPEYSRLNPKLFTWIFIGCDVGSIILQAAGGGVANAAGTDQDMINAGNNIIIAGIAFQVATMSICGILALDFFIASRKHWRGGSPREDMTEKRGKRMWWGFSAEVAAYTTVLIRCIYR